MRRILVTYDLRAPERDYSKLYAAIEAYSHGQFHLLESVWIIFTSRTPEEVREDLTQHVDRNDQLYAVDISGKASSWRGLPKLKGWLDAHKPD